MTHPPEKAGGRPLVDAVIDFISGSLGGVATVYVGQPLDTIKVKMQTFPTLYHSMLHCSKETWLKEGIVRGFYAGTTPALLANIAENSVLFAGYGACQKVVAFVTGTQSTQDLSVLSNATAGCMAAFFTAFALCPTELIKCRLQAMREMQAQSSAPLRNKIGPFGLTRQVIKQEGIAGMFRGLTSTILREMPGYFVFFGGYEGCRELIRAEGHSKDDIGPLGTMAAGAVGGILFWTAVFPADVVKSRIQVSGSKQPAVQLMLQIFRQEGLLALYNGLRPTLIRTIPASAALFLAYENSKKLLHNLVGH